MSLFFPEPYEDEILYSVISRYHYYVGSTNVKYTFKELFGNINKVPTIELWGNISDICGMSIYSFDADLDYLLAFSNTSISIYILDALNPTLNYQAGDIGRLPIIYDNKQKGRIDSISKKNIELSKNDWDKYESSWNFKRHPLV